MRSAYFSILALGLLFGCASSKIKGTGEGQTLRMKPVTAKAELGKAASHYDPFTVESAAISGNTLTMSIHYTGGCADHEFRLVGSEMISKSMPPIRSVRLVHNANGDTCKATVKKTFKFDLTELAYKKEPGSEIVLKIEGVAEPMRWIYK